MKIKFRLTIEKGLLRKAQDLADQERKSLDDFFAQLMEKMLAESEAEKVILQKRTRRRT